MVLATDLFRYTLIPEDRERMEEMASRIIPGCILTAIPCFFTERAKLHRIRYDSYLRQVELSQTASRNNIVKSLEQMNQYNDLQDDIFDSARKIRREWDSDTLQGIGRAARQIFPTDVVKSFH